MAFARPIRDIRTGDIFLDRRDGSRVIIVAAGNNYVEFFRGRGQEPEIFYERHFRDRFESIANHELRLLTPDERRACKRQFVMSLANLDRVRVYWRAAKRRITVRSVATGPQPRGQHTKLPDDAHQIGTYTHPFNPDQFLSDLHDRLVELQAEAQRSAASVAG